MLDSSQSWTRQTLMVATVDFLTNHNIPEARRNAEWMVESALKCSRMHLYAYPDHEVPPEQVVKLERMLARRVQREPVQYIVGSTMFYGLCLRVTPAVLIPRPETEEVVEAALRLIEKHSQPRVLDIGTGSGAIALAIKQERPDSVVLGCDISVEALAVATGNATTNELDVTFFQEDVLNPGFLTHAPGPFHLIISNPPYVPPAEAETLAVEVRDHEPQLALFSSGDPLQFYRAIIHQAKRLLHEGGVLVFETHADYGEQVRALLANARFTDAQIQPDLSGRARIASGRWGRGGTA